MRVYLQLCLLFLGMLCLSACGFHLRDNVTVAPILEPVYIASDSPNSPFVQTLKRQFTANNIGLTDDLVDARSILTVSDIKTTNLLTSLRGGSQAGQYTVTASVNFKSKTHKDQIMLTVGFKLAKQS